MAPRPADPSLLVPGRRARLCGLVSRRELNGVEVVVQSWEVAAGRLAVSLVDGSSTRLSVCPGNVCCDGLDFRARLGDNDELLAAAVLPHLDVPSLCRLRSADARLVPMVRLELQRRPLRWRFEFDWRHAPESRREALFERAWCRGGFASDKPTDWFCDSTAPRGERPTELRFSVGDLFQHQSTGYLGYVLGWDSRTKAPREWVEAHRHIHAPGTRYDRLFAPHLSVREFVPDRSAPQGVSFQTRYVIEDNLQPFEPDGIGKAEAQAVQDAFCRRTGADALPPKFLWRVLRALHDDAMHLKILAIAPAYGGLTVLGGRPGEDSLYTKFDALDGAMVPRPRVERETAGEDDFVFQGSGRLTPNAALRNCYPQDDAPNTSALETTALEE